MSNLYSYELDKYIKENEKYLGNKNSSAIKNIIKESNIPITELYDLKFKSPTIATILAVCFGWLGIDRYYAGDYIHGTIKLFTYGIYFIDWFIDIVIIRDRIKAKNFQKLYKYVTETDIDVNLKLDKDKVKNLWKNKEFRRALKDYISSHKSFMDTMYTNDKY